MGDPYGHAAKDDAAPEGRRSFAPPPVRAPGPGGLASRLAPPRLHVALVRRRAVDRLLLPSTEPLVLLSAPAGAGKTVTLTQWAARDPRPVAWLRLDPADNDPVLFALSLAMALRHVAAVSPGALDRLDAVPVAVETEVLPAIADAVATAGPFLFVLDDAHHVRNGDCWRWLWTLLGQLPARAQLAVASRSDPPLPLARLRAQGELLELRFDQLAFDPQETAELLRLHDVEAEPGTITRLLEATEGWATGIYLALLAGAGRPPEEWLPSVHGDQQAIAAYLLDEVLERQSGERRAFLEDTAIVDELSAPLCAAVTGRADCGAVLAHLARDNLFVSALDGRGERYRYHHLFAELLRSRLERDHPERLVPLHRAAAAWYAAQGDAERAVRHHLAAGDVAATADLVARTCDRYLESGRQESARRLLLLFSEEQLLSDPRLAITAGWVFAACIGTPEEQRRWMSLMAGYSFENGRSPDGAASLASSYTILIAELAPWGLHRQRDDFRRCIPQETREGTSWYLMPRAGYARALYFTGASDHARSILRRLLAEAGDEETAAGLATQLSLIAMDEGRWDEAAALLAGAERLEPDLGLQYSPGFCSFVGLQLAHLRLLSHRGDEGTMDFARRVADYADRMVHRAPWVRLFVLVTLAEVALERGELEASTFWTTEAARILQAYPDAGVFTGRIGRLQRALARRSTAEPLTAAETRVLELLPTHLSIGQLAVRLFLSRNTVKTHVRSIYRKLEVGSRAAAVDRARELGLLRR